MSVCMWVCMCVHVCARVCIYLLNGLQMEYSIRNVEVVAGEICLHYAMHFAVNAVWGTRYRLLPCSFCCLAGSLCCRFTCTLFMYKTWSALSVFRIWDFVFCTYFVLHYLWAKDVKYDDLMMFQMIAANHKHNANANDNDDDDDVAGQT